MSRALKLPSWKWTSFVPSVDLGASRCSVFLLFGIALFELMSISMSSLAMIMSLATDT